MYELEIPPSLSDRIAHILSAVDAVEEGLRGASEEALIKDQVRRLALERLLEIICVASGHIPASIKARENSVNWKMIAAVGDRLEDTRDRIEADFFRQISKDVLTPLRIWAEHYQLDQQ
jgi:uncharacterized protein with HEPN domain